MIERNRIHDCGALPSTNKDHGIYVSEARGTVIRDNWIYDNADRGVQLYPDADGTPITGNVIDSNGEGIVFAGTGAEVSSNNLVDRQRDLELEAGLERLLATSTGETPAGQRVARQLPLGRRRARPTFRVRRGRGAVIRLGDFTANGNVVADPRYSDPAAATTRSRRTASARSPADPATRRSRRGLGSAVAAIRSRARSTDICAQVALVVRADRDLPASCSRSPTTSM